MNEHDQGRIKQLLMNSLPPISARVGTGLRHDLWPAMLKRLEASSPRCRGLTGLSSLQWSRALHLSREQFRCWSITCNWRTS